MAAKEKSNDSTVVKHANLATAVIAVMREVKGMEKNSRVGGNSSSAYDGTKDQDVKEIFNNALEQNGLCILPIDIIETTQIDRWEEVDPWSKETPKATKMKQSVFTKVNCRYKLLHESGESEILAGYGHGVDPQDKGAGKATTYALKNCLLYSFLTPVGKIDDAEKNHSNDIATPQTNPTQVKSTPAKQQAAKPKLTKEQAVAKTISTINAVTSKKALNETWAKVPKKLQEEEAIKKAAAAKQSTFPPKKSA